MTPYDPGKFIRVSLGGILHRLGQTIDWYGGSLFREPAPPPPPPSGGLGGGSYPPNGQQYVTPGLDGSCPDGYSLVLMGEFGHIPVYICSWGGQPYSSGGGGYTV